MVASAAATLDRVVTVEQGELTLVAVDDGAGGDGRLLLHDGKQLQRKSPDPCGNSWPTV